MKNELKEEIEFYGDPQIESKDARIPKFLLLTYWILPFWGIFTFYLYWNGSSGWLDRGYWHQLQIAANTTFPSQNQNMPNQQNIQLSPSQEKQLEKDLE